jgi:hypothetical protein
LDGIRARLLRTFRHIEKEIRRNPPPREILSGWCFLCVRVVHVRQILGVDKRDLGDRTFENKEKRKEA